MKVKFVDYGKEYWKIYQEINEAVKRVFSNGDFILRGDVEKFEENLAEFVGTKYAIGVNSGTDALFLSLKALGIERDNEVITVGHTFHATVEAIANNGATPVLVDVNEHGLMDVKELNKLFTSRTKGIIPVHLMGDVCDMETINEAFKDYIVVEDACQAFGAVRNPVSDAQCWSFYPAKILGSAGDAGAITTNDKYLADELKEMRNHYKINPSGKYGFNSRLDNLQAAILNVKLSHIDDYLARRYEIAQMYDEGLKDLPIKLPRKRPVYQDYIIQSDKRDELFSFLSDNGIETMKNAYPFPIPKPQKTTELEQRTLRLPCRPEHTDEEINYVIQKVKEFYD